MTSAFQPGLRLAAASERVKADMCRGRHAPAHATPHCSAAQAPRPACPAYQLSDRKVANCASCSFPGLLGCGAMGLRRIAQRSLIHTACCVLTSQPSRVRSLPSDCDFAWSTTFVGPALAIRCGCCLAPSLLACNSSFDPVVAFLLKCQQPVPWPRKKQYLPVGFNGPHLHWSAKLKHAWVAHAVEDLVEVGVRLGYTSRRQASQRQHAWHMLVSMPTSQVLPFPSKPYCGGPKGMSLYLILRAAYSILILQPPFAYKPPTPSRYVAYTAAGECAA
eukprot:37897-Chlamydomonas_euryale.AAC.8